MHSLFQSQFVQVAVSIVLYLMFRQPFVSAAPAVLIANQPYENYITGLFHSKDQAPTIMQVQRICFTNLDVNASQHLTKVMTRINGQDVVGWGYTLDEAKADAINNAKTANDIQAQLVASQFQTDHL